MNLISEGDLYGMLLFLKIGNTLLVIIHECWSLCSWKFTESLFPLSRAEQERTQLSALDMQPFLDFVKRGNLQTEFFSVGPNQCECSTCWIYFYLYNLSNGLSLLRSAICDRKLWFVDLVTSIHENWFCARCVNSTKSGGEGVIVMQIGAYLLVSMYVPFFQLPIIQFMETGYHIFLPIVAIKLCYS